jgi:chloramphenicol O-acetyltransferase type A
MRHINLETWPRRAHFQAFRTWDYPHFNMCANLDLTAFRPYVKRHGISFNVATVYVIACAANAIPEFRYRIWGEEVVEHEVVHPATTRRIAAAKENLTVEDEPGTDDWLFMTAIPSRCR